MSKNALVRIKWASSRDQSQEAGELSSVSCKSTSRSNKLSFVSNRAREITLTGLPPTVLMVASTAVRHAGVSVVCIEFWVV